jgi:hypothetical protein
VDTVVLAATESPTVVELTKDAIVPLSGAPATPAPRIAIYFPTSAEVNEAADDENWLVALVIEPLPFWMPSHFAPKSVMIDRLTPTLLRASGNVALAAVGSIAVAVVGVPDVLISLPAAIHPHPAPRRRPSGSPRTRLAALAVGIACELTRRLSFVERQGNTHGPRLARPSPRLPLLLPHPISPTKPQPDTGEGNNYVKLANGKSCRWPPVCWFTAATLFARLEMASAFSNAEPDDEVDSSAAALHAVQAGGSGKRSSSDPISPDPVVHRQERMRSAEPRKPEGLHTGAEQAGQATPIPPQDA